MTDRKTPILLRCEPMSGRIVAVTRYTHVNPDVIRAAINGKHDVTDEFCRLCEELGMGVPPGYQRVSDPAEAEDRAAPDPTTLPDYLA